MTAEHPTITRVRVYPDTAGEYRWTAYSSNGRAIAVSSEGYVDPANASGAAGALFPDAELEVTVEPAAPQEKWPGER